MSNSTDSRCVLPSSPARASRSTTASVSSLPTARKATPASTYPPPPETIHVTDSADPTQAVLNSAPSAFGALLAVLVDSAVERLNSGADISLGRYLERPTYLSLALVTCSPNRSLPDLRCPTG
ncbi:hypothetical protein ACWD26_39445 [Streptomyces sp. NPDC002787]